MTYPIFVPNHGKGLKSEDGYQLGYNVREDGDRIIFTTPEGHKATMRREGLKSFTVSLGDTKVMAAHYDGTMGTQWCCVTCNGFTFCAYGCCCGEGADQNCC